MAPLLAAVLVLAAGQPAPPTVPVHGRWEATLTASADAAPDTDVRLSLTGPDGKAVTVPAFWDGGRVWKARFRPDAAGTWKYTVASAPKVPGLDAAGGSFAAVAEKSDNRFRQHGPVRVAKSGPHLEHADGTPFFFLADTAWNGPAFSTPEAWRAYLKDRRGKKFSAVQFNVCTPWRAADTDADGRTTLASTTPVRVDPAYFRRVDARMDAIEAAGLLAAPVLLWANTKGDIGWDLAEADAVAVARYVVARYHAHPVLWVLAGDNGYGGPHADRWRRVGRAVFGDAPAAPMTTHPTGMNFPWPGWEGEKWLTVFGYQSGHGDDAKTWRWLHSGPPAEYGRRSDATRPVINLEPPYEDHVAYQSRKRHSAYNVRRASYWSLLVDPPAGVTYGGHGIWGWATEPGKEPLNHKGTGGQKVWDEAVGLPGSGEMTHVVTLFESLPWTQLRPARDLVAQTDGRDDPAKFVACAATPDRKVVVAYFPAGAKARLVPQPSDDGPVSWFDPRTGQTKKGGFDPPDGEDWVMVVRR